MGNVVSFAFPSPPCSETVEAAAGGHHSAVRPFRNKNDILADSEMIQPGFLHTACSQGKLSTVKYIVEKLKYDVEGVTHGGMTPLHCACQTGSLSVVKYLVLKQNVNVEARARRLGLDRSALEIAFYNGRMDVVRFLVTVIQIDDEVMRLAWVLKFPWDVRWQLLEYYHPTRRGQRNELFRTYPLQAILSCPLPSYTAFMECIIQFPPTCWTIVDEQGRLPLHVALDSAASNNTNRGITPELILALVAWEPRAARMKDPTTGLFPFLAAGFVRNDLCEDTPDRAVRPSWLDVVFALLLDQDPEIMLRACHVATTERGWAQAEGKK